MNEPHLTSHERCCGCSACSAKCPTGSIQLIKDAYGFHYPKINLKSCVGCLQCEKVCPVKNNRYCSDEITRSYAVKSRDINLRMSSSSGGIFSELSRAVLKRGGLILGAAFDDDYSVHHIMINREDDLKRIRGAKYAQSDIKDSFSWIKEKLDCGCQILFSGTPCQVAGLKAYLGIEYENLITIDFICHGVPSPQVWENYIKYRMRLDLQKHKPIYINLRDKATGWSKYKYSVLFHYENGEEYRALNSEDLFMRLFVKDLINCQACATCEFKGVHRKSDFTLGDFWGIWNCYPEFDDNQGVSAIIIHSKKGEKLLDSIRDRLEWKEVEVSNIAQYNQALVAPFQAGKKRDVFLKLLVSEKWDKAERLLDRKNSLRDVIMELFSAIR